MKSVSGVSCRACSMNSAGLRFFYVFGMKQSSMTSPERGSFCCQVTCSECWFILNMLKNLTLCVPNHYCDAIQIVFCLAEYFILKNFYIIWGIFGELYSILSMLGMICTKDISLSLLFGSSFDSLILSALFLSEFFLVHLVSLVWSACSIFGS